MEHLLAIWCVWQPGAFQENDLLVNQQLALPPSWLLEGDAADQRQQEVLWFPALSSHSTPGFKGKGSWNTLYSDIKYCCLIKIDWKHISESQALPLEKVVIRPSVWCLPSSYMPALAYLNLSLLREHCFSLNPFSITALFFPNKEALTTVCACQTLAFWSCKSEAGCYLVLWGLSVISIILSQPRTPHLSSCSNPPV